MLKHFAHIKTNLRVKLSLFILTMFVLISEIEMNAQNHTGNIDLGFRAGLNMTTINGDNESGLKVGLTAGAGGKFHISENSSLLAELLYTTGGMSANKSIDTTSVKVKIYDKIHLHYLAIPIVYQYYFTDILGIEIGPQVGFCLGGKEKNKIGNESWVPSKLSPTDYNVFDCGILAGIYTNNITQENDFLISLRVYFGLTNVMKYGRNNKNICIQFGIGYIIGK